LLVPPSKSVLGQKENEVDEISLPALQVIAKTGRLGADLGYFYLQKELKLSEHHMVQIMEKYPWIMYLKVDTNLRPTVEVLKSFGFRDKDVRSMLQTVPPILGINHEWTLPEKLISIQKMFNLNRAGLVKLVVDQPFLLTCSIDRNIKVSEFLSETVGLSPESIRNCLLCCPEVAMSGITKMAACWSVLTDIYGLSDKQARVLIESYPIVLTHRTLRTIQDKVSFFSEELNMSPPFREVQKIIMRYPQLLCIDPNVFMRPNVALLKKHLELDRDGISKLISFFPSALGYNPRTLERILVNSLFMLSGLEEFNTQQGGDEEMEVKIFQGEEQNINDLDILDQRPVLLSAGDIRNIELAASSFLDVQDGDILSLHILPPSMNPLMLMNTESNDMKGEPNIIVTEYQHENDSDKYIKDGEYSGEWDKNDVTNSDLAISNDSQNSYESGEDGLREEKKMMDRNIEEMTIIPSTEQSAAQNNGVDVIADIVARARIKGEVVSRVPASVTSIAEIIAAAVSFEEQIDNSNDNITGSTFSNKARAASIGGSLSASMGLDSSIRHHPHATSHHNRAAHAANEIEAMRLMMLVYSTLNIEKSRALGVVRSAPWVLSYRPERSLRILSTIGFSLGMSRSELSKLVTIYPRVLSLSVDGKVSDVLTALAESAAKCLSLQKSEDQLRVASLFKSRKGSNEAAAAVDEEGETELARVLMSLASLSFRNGGGSMTQLLEDEDVNGIASSRTTSCNIALIRRRDPVRTMVRTALLKWPLLLGTSMARISAAMEELVVLHVPFDQLVQIIRRNPKAQLKWKMKVVDLTHAAKQKEELAIEKEKERLIKEIELELWLKNSLEENNLEEIVEIEEVGEIEEIQEIPPIQMESEADMEIEIEKDEEKKKIKKEKKQKKVEFMKRIQKLLKPSLRGSKASPLPRLPPVAIDETDMTAAIEIELDVKKKQRKKGTTKKSKKNKEE